MFGSVRSSIVTVAFRNCFISIFLLFSYSLSFAQSASISASVQSPIIAIGASASTNITWSISGASQAQVWVSVDNAQEVLFATGPSGQKSFSQIRPGVSYKFTVYKNLHHTVPLASILVLGVPQNGGILAAPENVVKAPFNGARPVALLWKTHGMSNAELWISMNGQPETLVERSASSTHIVDWIVPGNDYQFRLYEGTSKIRVLDSINIYADLEYEVGVNYHAFTEDFSSGQFITQYQYPDIRNLVKSQLLDMINRGASVIKFNIWHTTLPGSPAFSGRPHFPLSSQEALNLKNFAQDVANTRASDGRRLKLVINLGWLGSAGYTDANDSPETGLGSSQLSGSQFIARAKQSVDVVVDAVKNVYRPDGRLVVEMIYLEGEVMPALKADIDATGIIDGKKNQDWFLENIYPYFVDKVSQVNIEPSIYFLVTAPDETAIFNPSWSDPLYSHHNVRPSMYHIYRAIAFLQNKGLKIPKRIDFSLYPKRYARSYSEIIKRVTDDADQSLHFLGAAKRYKAVETQYPLLSSDREALGLGFANNRYPIGKLEGVYFWSTPDGGGAGVHVGPPFEVEDYWPY